MQEGSTSEQGFGPHHTRKQQDRPFASASCVAGNPYAISREQAKQGRGVLPACMRYAFAEGLCMIFFVPFRPGRENSVFGKGLYVGV
jgi:hypothetical protein